MGGVTIPSFRAKSRNPVAQFKGHFAGCLDFARHDRRMCEMDSKIIQHEQSPMV
jgi:hypothetical protein